MSHTPPKSSKFSQMPGKILSHPETGEDLLFSAPNFRKGNSSFLKSRGLQLLNALAALKVQVVGSFWLPGMHLFTPEKLEEMRNIPGVPDYSLFVGTSDAPVAERNWYSFKGDPLMVVENRWETVEEYVASFKKKYRARYRKAMDLNERVETYYVSSERDFQECCEMFQATLAPKVAALPDNLSVLLEGFGHWFGDSYQVLAAQEDGQIVGFIGFLKDGDVLRAMHYGALDEAPDGLYSLLMFEVIHRGIQGGFAEINLGRTATEIKSTYGAKARENYFSFYTNKPVIKMILKVAHKRYRPKSYTLRSPFKAT
ncbi:MAG: GNAT family N-acetyltransferase [Bacteroidetes bacterium]|nr:MAG: GNAT family N-acetyltransferase [Bacteroidota bacterium]